MGLEIEINNKNNSIDAEITHRQLELDADIGESELYVEKDYNDLVNKPSINNVTLEGNKTSDDLNLQSKITEENKLDYNLLENEPTKTSEFTNNGEDGSSPYATQKWVLDNEIEGKIDKITRNGEELSIIDKTVNIEVPTKNSELENDSNFATEEYVNKYGSKIDSIQLNGETLSIENKNVNIEIDKSDVGLSNVDNTSDIDKPISTKQQEAITKVQSNIDSEVANRIESDKTLQTNIETVSKNLTNEISNRESADSILQTNIDSESSTREANDKTLQSNLTAHEQNTSNPHKVTKSQIGLSEVDNTSDKDKPVSTATQSALDLKLDKENANLSMAKDIGVSTEGDNVYLDVSYKNLSTKVESENKKQIKLASDTEAGLMSIADYAQIRKNTEDIGQLKDQNIRLLYTTSENPTSEDIKNFVTNEGYTDITKWISIAVVVQNTNHIWRYYDNTQIWQDIGVDTVNLWTNELAGIVKGSSVDGKIYAETDGTASVNGWADLKSSVSNEISNRESVDKELQTNINNETSARQSADTTLQSNIDTLDGQVVKLDIDQTIPSIKTFSNYIKTPQVASVEGKGLVRYKGTEGKSVYGNDSTGNVLMGNTDRPSYSKSGSDFTGTELALYNDVTAETNARTSADTTLQSNIDSEASTREASDTNLQSQISTNATNIANKVDKVTGKGLSTNDFTTAYKNQIDTNTTNIAKKLEASNIKAGTNITVSTSGNDVTIDAKTGEGGTNVYVNNVKQDSINFTSDPQTQINTNATNIATNTTNISVKADLTASNLSADNVTSWQQKLITSAIAGNGISISNGVISGVSMTTLWTNPSPSSSFSEQTITLSSSDWDFLIIVSSMYYGYEAGRYGTITFDGTASLYWVAASSDSSYTWEIFARRITAISKTSLKVGDCYYIRKGNYDATKNTHNQPLKIIGVKVA